MFQGTPVSFSTEITGQKITLQTGLLAKQATSSVLATIGNTTVLCSVVVGKETQSDYFPLQVIYEERLYASGKIKGSRFVKREGRPTDNAVLTGRLVDRSIRSLFPDSIRNEIQIVITVLSLDENNPPDVISVLAASSALCMCGLNDFKGPVSSLRVGIDLNNNKYAINPNYEILNNGLLDLVISGNGDNIVMLESAAGIVEEKIIEKALEVSNYYLKELTQFQFDFLTLAMDAKLYKEISLINKELPNAAQTFFNQFHAVIENIMFSTKKKEEKNNEKNLFKNNLLTELKTLQKEFSSTNLNNGEQPAPLEKYGLTIELLNLILNNFDLGFDNLSKKIIEKNILEKERRVDGRKLDETREIKCQIDCLDAVHASSLFERGETQVLNILTLGTSSDAQLLDDMENFEEEKKRYIHHYNFPAYSVGETGRYAGPGRREIGHGALAERALIPVLPSEEDFPYTIRTVSECLGSNGSTSMASTCASTLSLMAGGVPIKAPVAGIAMGLIIGKYEQNVDFSNVILESERLILKPVEKSYAEDIFKTYNLKVTEFLTRGPNRNIEETLNFIKFCEDEARDKKMLTLEVLDKSYNFLGLIDLHNIHTGHPEIGIWIREDFWGQGIAIEAINLLLDWAKENLNYGHIKYIYDERNINSAKISQKLGFIPDHYFTMIKRDTGALMPVLETRFYEGGKRQNYKLLTDIQGLEDHFGDMDFKITGTREGITAFQLDNKAAGLTVEILQNAIQRSKEARLHILDIMEKCIEKPRKEISSSAPRVETLNIPYEKVGDVIGPSGKIIKSIIAKTGVAIDIEDDTGKTFIYGKDGKKVKEAKNIILNLIKEYKLGDRVYGKIFRLETYGAFIKIEGTEKEGMIHISAVSKDRNKKMQDFYHLGEGVDCEILEINEKGQIRLGIIK